MTGFIVLKPAVIGDPPPDPPDPTDPPDEGGSGPGAGGSGPVDDGRPGLGVPTPESHFFRLRLRGVDGSDWDLSEGKVGVLLAPQVFASPTVSHWWKTSPRLDGARWDGMRTGSRAVALPVVVEGSTWRDWRDTDAAFFRAVHPSGECVFSVTSPDSVTRSLRMRFVAGGDIADSDPLISLSTTYMLEFTAANPFWTGEPVRAEFKPEAPVPFFPGPPWAINAASASGQRKVTNPGTEDAWARHLIEGPALSWAIDVGGGIISSDHPLLEGQSVSIDTDLAKLTVVDEDGVNVYGNLDQDVFAPIPAGVDVPISWSMEGFGPTSRIETVFDTHYRRPW